MPGGCSVPLCNGSGGFKFPKDSSLKKEWCVAIKRASKYGGLWTPKSGYELVCEKHFRPEQIVLQAFGSSTRKHLKEGVVPSIFTFRKPPAEPSPREVRLRNRRSEENKQNPVVQTPVEPMVVEAVEDKGVRTDEVPDFSFEIEVENPKIEKGKTNIF